MGSPLGWGCSQKSLITRNTTVGMELSQVRRDTSRTAEQRLYQRKPAVHYFHAAPSLLNARAADGMLRPALPAPGAPIVQDYSFRGCPRGPVPFVGRVSAGTTRTNGRSTHEPVPVVYLRRGG